MSAAIDLKIKVPVCTTANSVMPVTPHCRQFVARAAIEKINPRSPPRRGSRFVSTHNLSLSNKKEKADALTPALTEHTRDEFASAPSSSHRGRGKPHGSIQADRRSVLLNANASGISCTPAVGPALLAHPGSGLADTVNHYPACATAHTGLRDHVVGLISWRERHCLCGGSERQPEQSKPYCSDHYFLPVVQTSFLCGLLGHRSRSQICHQT